MTSHKRNVFSAILLLCLCVVFLPRLPLAAETLLATRVINGKSFETSSGKTVRLAALQAPNPQESLAKESRMALMRLLKGQKLTISALSAADRHGRIIAFVTLVDGRLVQEEMIRQGMALVYPLPPPPQDAANRARRGAQRGEWGLSPILEKLLAAESAARREKLGLWAHPYWQPLNANKLPPIDTAERYQLVEGVVQNVARAGGNWYVNFGQDYKTDVTAILKDSDARKYFKGIDLKGWAGKRVLLRGWSYPRDGLTVEIIVPEQMILL